MLIRKLLLLFFAAALLACSPLWKAEPAAAHASLVEAVPAANSKLKESPAEIAVTFNERLDEGLFYIKVYDQQGKEATSVKAVMNDRHDGLRLSLPKLPEGVYAVSYHVISEDGHPVGGTYPITVGDPPLGEGSASLPAGGPHDHGGAGALDPGLMIQYACRGLWFLALLAVAGWTVWLRLPGAGGAAVRHSLSGWTLNLQRAHLIALLLLIFTHIEDLLGEGGFEAIWQLFLATRVGISWLLLLLLAFAGFALVGRRAWADAAWAAALLGAKSFSGHAAAFAPQAATIALDWLHLAAAAVWAGGLLMLGVHWRKQSENRLDFARAFSNAAFAAVVVLTLSGIASVWLFLPSFKYLLYTQWGILLLVKTGAVLLVMAVGGTIRLLLRRKRERLARGWYKADFALLLVIVGLVGLITYMSPIPPNEPLQWHVMGEKVHMSADIAPKAPGTNKFHTTVWLPEEAGAPKQVQLILRYADNSEVAPIQVPLERIANPSPAVESFGSAQYSYEAEGAYLPFRGGWTVEVRVMDADDNETVYNKEFIVY